MKKNSFLSVLLLMVSGFSLQVFGLEPVERVALGENDFFWEMKPLLGRDLNLNGKIDIPNTAESVQIDEFEIEIGLSVSFLATLDSADEKEFQTIVSLSSSSNRYDCVSPGFSVNFDNLPAEVLSGTITCYSPTAIYKGEISFEPKQLIIASFGDSYSSGEGVPESIYTRHNPSIWADGGPGSNAMIDHARSHRSSLAWPAQSALYLEQEDPHSVVSFVFLASSGAQIDDGVIVPYQGIDDSPGGKMIPQVDELASVMGDREVDYLLIGIGGNDLGLVRAATFGVVYIGRDEDPQRDKHLRNLDALVKSVETGYWDCPGAVIFGYKKQAPRAGLNGLSARYDALQQEIDLKLKVKNTLLVGYPLPVVAGDKALFDMFPGLKLDAVESDMLINRIMGPLNSVMKSSAQRNGWQFISINEGAYDFAPHTYQNPEPYPAAEYIGYPPAYPLNWEDFRDQELGRNVRWFRTATEAVVMQGADLNMEKAWVMSTKGTLHPNEICQQAVMHQVLRFIPLPSWFPSDFQKAYPE